MLHISVSIVSFSVEICTSAAERVLLVTRRTHLSIQMSRKAVQAILTPFSGAACRLRPLGMRNVIQMFNMSHCGPCAIHRLMSTIVVSAGMESADVELPRHRISTAFSRSSGAGGQNVNKLNTKAELRFHIGDALWIDDHTKDRLRALFPNSVTRDGELVITSQRHRTQEGNLEDAFEKLHAMVVEAAQIPKERELKSEVTESTKDRYREDKRHRRDLKDRRRAAKGGSWDD